MIPRADNPGQVEKWLFIVNTSEKRRLATPENLIMGARFSFRGGTNRRDDAMRRYGDRVDVSSDPQPNWCIIISSSLRYGRVRHEECVLLLLRLR